MKYTLAAVFVLLLASILLVPAASAQQASSQPMAKPYHNGPVWDIGFVHVKPGMDDRYLRYIAADWKREQEALKKAGYVLDYKVIQTEAHGPQDFNIMLMTEFKDLASLEANEEKMEALGQQMFGGMQKIEGGFQDRASYREILADRLGREIILEPATTTTASK